VQFFQKTHVGRVREHNEDSSYSDPAGRFFVVADGMGGHAAGEVASQLAVDEVRAMLEKQQKIWDDDPTALTTSAMETLIKSLAEQANRAVRQRAERSPSTRGMGTTLEVLLLTGNGAWIGHVGDSRTYLVRGSEVSQLTHDQTIANQLSASQKQAMGDALQQYDNVLAEAIGARVDVKPAVAHAELQSGDLLLSCSDGLYQYFPRAQEMGEIFAMDGPKAGLDRLVDLALERGGKDNITGLLVEVVEHSPSASRPDDGRSAAQQGYGIEEALRLMRLLPQGDSELVLRVLRNSLASAGVLLGPIIRDAGDKQERLSRAIKEHNHAIEEMRQQVASCQQEIAALEEDRAETLMVKGHLERALSRPSKQA
jgi:protein phosphatase